MKTFWGWWKEWDDTALKKFDPWQLSVTEAPHNMESSRVSGEEKMFLWNLKARLGLEPRYLTFQGGSFNHCTMAPAFHY